MNFDRTLVEIRERPFLELLDLALVVGRERPLTLLLATAAGIAPFAALNALLIPTDEADSIVYYLLAFWLEAPFATAPLTLTLGALMFGEPVAPRRIARSLLRGAVPMLLYQGGLRWLLTPIYPVVLGRFGFLNEVLLLERYRWRAVAARSARLSRGRGADLVAQWHAQLLFGLVFVVIASLGMKEAYHTFFKSDLTFVAPGLADLASWRVQAAAWAAIAFFGVARFLIYIDQRIRSEGWEVMRRLRVVAASLEERERWDR